MRLCPILRIGNDAPRGQANTIRWSGGGLFFWSHVPYQLWHCASGTLGPLEQLTSILPASFRHQESSCCLCKTIILLMMCGAEVCPLLFIVWNGWRSVRWGSGKGGDRS